MNKRITRVYDPEIADCFELFGGEKTAIYFETLRYRQQLSVGEPFVYMVKDITKRTGLSKYHQKIARDVLAAVDFIDVIGNGNAYKFQVTEAGNEAVKKTPRRRNLGQMRRDIVNGFSLNYNKAG